MFKSDIRKGSFFLLLAALVYSGICVWITLSTADNLFFDFRFFLLCLLVTHVVWFATVIFYHQKAPQFLPNKGWILLGAILFRFILLPVTPLFEDDFLRYLWDGFLSDRFGSPYGLIPEDFYSDATLSAQMESVLDVLSYPEVPTVYGPMAELVFYIAYLISPGEVWSLKVLFFVADVIVLFVLSKRLDSKKLLLFSWCPLLVFQFSLNAHVDILAVCFLMLAHMYSGSTFANSKRWYLAPLLMCFAICAKVFALLAVPFILIRMRQYVFLVISLLLVYLPILFNGASEFEGLKVMASSWQFNSLLYRVGQGFLAQSTLKMIGLLVFVGVYCILLWKVAGPGVTRSTEVGEKENALALVYLAFFICMPVVNAWYLVWVLCFAVFTVYRWPWCFSILVWASLFHGLNVGEEFSGSYEIPIGVLGFEYGLLLLVLLFEARSFVNRGKDKRAE